jgi:hypothetical protein
MGQLDKSAHRHRSFRDRNRKVVEDYMTALVEGMHVFRTNKSSAYRAIMELTRQRDPVLLEWTYDDYAKQYEAINGVPRPWQAGIESMIAGSTSASIRKGSKIATPSRFSTRRSCSKPWSG